MLLFRIGIHNIGTLNYLPDTGKCISTAIYCINEILADKVIDKILPTLIKNMYIMEVVSSNNFYRWPVSVMNE